MRFTFVEHVEQVLEEALHPEAADQPDPAAPPEGEGRGVRRPPPTQHVPAPAPGARAGPAAAAAAAAAAAPTAGASHVMAMGAVPSRRPRRAIVGADGCVARPRRGPASSSDASC